MNKSHLLINEQALQVLPSLALALGLEEAIAIQQLHYWLNNQKNEGRIDDEGNKWVYNTYAEWKEDNFPFWSEDKIQRVFLSLQEQGVVIAKQLDAKKRDMRKFYRIDYDKLCAMDDAILRPSNTVNLHDVKMNHRLPENTTESPSKISKQDLANMSVEAAIYGGLTPSQEIINKERLETEATSAFESAFHITRPWSWYADERTWKDFRKWVVARYTEDPECFSRYFTWSQQPYVKGSMNNVSIKRNPELFPDSWDVFKLSDAKEKESIPQYKPLPEDNNVYVPNPKRRNR